MPAWRHLTFASCLASLIVASAEMRASRLPSQGAQEPEISALTTQLAEAEKLLRERKGNEALPLFEGVLDGASALKHDAVEADARAGIGEILLYRAQYAAVRDQGARALAIYQRLDAARGIGRVSHLLSSAEEYSGNLTEARAHAERAVAAFEALNEPRGRAISTMQLLRVKRVPEDERRTLFNRVVEDARLIGDRNIEGTALHSQGDGLFVQGQYVASLETLMRAEEALLTTTNIEELGTVYNSIGRVYRAHGRLDQALAYQLKALTVHEKANQPFTLMQSLNAVATVYQRMADFRNARRYYERALTIAEQSSSVRVQDLIRAGLGGLLIEQGQAERGAAVLEQVIANGVDAYPSRRYAALSGAYRQLGRSRDALDAATKAVDRCAKEESACVAALTHRAAAYTTLGDSQAALTDVNTALADLEATRARLVPNDFFKQDFHRAQQNVYSQAIALQVREKLDRQALETAELARSRAFLDLLASRDVQVKERDRARLASLQESDDRTPSRIELRASGASTTAGLTLRGGESATGPSALTRPAIENLELRSFVAATPSATDDLVATASRLESTLVVYWVGDEELFIWAVTPVGRVHTRRVSVLQARLVELIRETEPVTETRAGRTIVTRGAGTIPVRVERPTAWRALYDVLIAPVRDVLPTDTGALLTIVPQGPLLNVSFAALQSPRGRYLLEDYALHYAPAGAVLQFTAPKKRADARTASMLVVADPTLPRLTSLDRPLPRLPGARSEAASIAQLVPASRLTVLQDSRATEVATREAAAGKAVLHFATHAVVSDDDPFASYLALGPSTSGGSDGLLTSQEVYGLDLSADLVVLSACRSAGGRVTGDGISAFARAFIYAGTASLVASVWDVADEPTNRLLPDFYKRWLGGASKSRALRDAQLALLRDLRAGRVRITTPVGEVAIPEHPVFWAGFALFGEPE